MSLPVTDENEIESKIEKDFESSLKRFGISDSSINSFMNGDGMLFTRSEPSKEELEQHKQALSKQGDYFVKVIELEEENQSLKQEIQVLKQQLEEKNKIISTLQKQQQK